MRRLAIALALITVTGTASAHDHSLSVRGDECTARNFRWDDAETIVARETIAGSGLRSIRATVDRAPVRVTGGSSGYSIEVCKAATNAADLAAIRVSLDGDELRATGPDNDHWIVLYNIRVPRNADVNVRTNNGPLSLRDVDGTIVAQSSNGPLSLHNVSGRVDASSKNGPISINGGSGTVKVQSSNGPLSVDLDGSSWQGGSLDASSNNGPLSVRIPRNYGSGIVVETNGRGPISCRAEGCSDVRRSRRDGDSYGWADLEPQRLEFGRGSEAVRLTTVNGPVTIKDDDKDDNDD